MARARCPVCGRFYMKEALCYYCRNQRRHESHFVTAPTVPLDTPPRPSTREDFEDLTRRIAETTWPHVFPPLRKPVRRKSLLARIAAFFYMAWREMVDE